MTYYHQNRQACLEAGKRFEPHWTTSAELDPYNGWVLVLRPNSPEVFNWPFAPLLEVAEIAMERRAKRPPADRKLPPKDAPSAPQRAAKAPIAPPRPPPPAPAGAAPARPPAPPQAPPPPPPRP